MEVAVTEKEVQALPSLRWPGPELRQPTCPLGTGEGSGCASAQGLEKVGRTMREVGVLITGLEDGGQGSGFLPRLCISLAKHLPGLAGGTHTYHGAGPLYTADVFSTTTNKVPDIKCVSGAHPFPSEPEHSKVNNTSCQEYKERISAQ